MHQGAENSHRVIRTSSSLLTSTKSVVRDIRTTDLRTGAPAADPQYSDVSTAGTKPNAPPKNELLGVILLRYIFF